MCGRFTLIHSVEALVEAFEIEEVLFTPSPSYNIPPGQVVPAVVCEGGVRKLVGLKWGLVPAWAEDPKIGNRMINARAETVASKPAFRDAFRKRRCIVPASGFYEWKRENSGKEPYYFYRPDGKPLGMAGIHERWVSPEGDELHTCAIITVDSLPPVSEVHGRMPLLLDGEELSLYLDPEAPLPRVARLLSSFTPPPLSCHRVSRAVNSPAVDAPVCIERV
ncbi:MAG: SOS response-associated peptidase [Deltaproteobacteria bacterium]|nr:MAG: SOS response-associated peptidase [Deltaproteobacteria bacterium]